MRTISPFLALSFVFGFVRDSVGPQCLTKGSCAQARDKDSETRIDHRCCWQCLQTDKRCMLWVSWTKTPNKVSLPFCDIKESNWNTFHFKIISWKHYKLQHGSCRKVQKQSGGLVSQINSQLHRNSDSCVLLNVISFLTNRNSVKDPCILSLHHQARRESAAGEIPSMESPAPIRKWAELGYKAAACCSRAQCRS